MINNFKKFPISFWSTTGWNRPPKEKVDTWNDLGITLPMMPCDLDNKEQVYKGLDRAAEHGMKVILCDPRANWRVLTKKGEDEYRRGMKEAILDFGSHSAMFGFYVGDEPDAPDVSDALLAMKINGELAPHLTAYMNLLPWFDWIGERMGSDAYAPYLDRIVREGAAKLISYDCYTQMWPEKRGYHDYFNNLREHYEATRRNKIPFMNTVLSCGHYDYACPTKDDMLWQLTTSVAHGASAVSWFFIELPGIWDNYRNAPINPLGDRTVEFDWLREVNCVFNNYCGEIMATLTVDKCYHVGEAFGGMPLFEPFDSIIDVSAHDAPLIASSFMNAEGERFYVICNNSPKESAKVSMKIKESVTLLRCTYGNKFEKVKTLTDPVGEKMNVPGQSMNFILAPGQMALFKET